MLGYALIIFKYVMIKYSIYLITKTELEII
jgi:hypothetical protein